MNYEGDRAMSPEEFRDAATFLSGEYSVVRLLQKHPPFFPAQIGCPRDFLQHKLVAKFKYLSTYCLHICVVGKVF